MSKLERAAHVAVILIAVAVVCAAMRIAQNVLLPAILAMVIGVVLSPISDFWEKIGAPRVIGALTSLVVTLLFMLLLALLIQPMVVRIVEAWPAILSETRGTLIELQNALHGLKDVGQEVDQALSGRGAQDGASAASAGTGQSASTDPIDLPSTADALVLAPSVAGQAVIFAGVLFFFLMTRRDIYAWIARRIAPDDLTEETAIRLRTAERRVSQYFVTITIINVGFGLLVTAAMGLLGVPAPYLWGAATCLFNYVLYLGPVIVFLSLGVAGIVVFDGAYSIVPALVYLGINMIEAQFVTPTALGARLSVNPLLIFLALVFFLWLWGPLGGFVAIPLLLWAMVLSNEITISQKDREELRAEDEATEQAVSGD